MTNRRRLSMMSRLTEEWSLAMMNGVMGQGMMWGMGVVAIVILLLVALAIAALIKYLFFR
jgi:hypothetical protein